MSPQKLDLVHELQLELGWEPDFAVAAHGEYKKWLNIRAKAGDFQNCKLPPSRVVAMVWSLHRNWSLDYQKTCANVGGYIHHFPPAMRMNMAREQAYAATVHMYKSVYKQDPPSSFWGPAICPYKPLSATPSSEPSAEPAQPEEPDPPPRALPSLRRAPPRRDSHLRSAASPKNKRDEKAKDKDKPESGRRSSYPTRLSTDDGGPVLEKPASATADAPKFARRYKGPKKEEPKNFPPGHIEEVVLAGEGTPRSSKSRSKLKRKLSGNLYVLKPLGPGEKRKRGRPSFADYILAADGTKSSSAAKSSGSKAGPGKSSASGKSSGPDQKKKDSKSASKSDRPSSTPVRRRRYGAASSSSAPVAPVIKKDKLGVKSFRRVGRAAANAVVAAAAVASKSASAAGIAKSSQPASSAQESQDGPSKRPRGRPRKESSGAGSRSRPTTGSTKGTAASASKGADGGSASTKDKKVKEKSKETAMEKAKEQGKEKAKENAKEKAKENAKEKAKENVKDKAEEISKDKAPEKTKEKVKDSMKEDVIEKAKEADNEKEKVKSEKSSIDLKKDPPVAAVKPSEKPVVPHIVENGSGPSPPESVAFPSKPIDDADVQMTPLSAKEGIAASLVLAENTPRLGSFDILDSAGAAEKAENGKQIPSQKEIIPSDPVFPQTDSLRPGQESSVDLEVPLVGMTRPDVMPLPTSMPIGVSVGLPALQSISQQGNNFAGVMKAVPIAPALVVPGMPNMSALPNIPAITTMPMPAMSAVPTPGVIPHLPIGNPLVENPILPVGGSGMAPKLGMEGDMGMSDGNDDDESKKPFRRHRARVRRDAQWTDIRKPLSDEAVERVKDLTDPTPNLNFQMGPSGPL